MVDGCAVTLDLKSKSNVVIMAQGHGCAHLKDRRLDVSLFVDFKQQNLGGVGFPGLGICRSEVFIPISAMSTATLEKGIHVIDLRICNPRNNGVVNLNGSGFVVQVFPI